MKNKIVKMMVLTAAMVLAIGCLAGCGTSGTAVVDGDITGEEIVADIEKNGTVTIGSEDEAASEDVTDETAASEDSSLEDTSSEDTTSEDSESADAFDNGQDVMEYITEKYTFNYDPTYFEAFEGETDEDVTVSFIYEGIEVAGSNVISISVVPDTNAEDVIRGYMEQFGAKNDEMFENYIAGEDTPGYCYSTGALQAEGSELKTDDTFYAVPSGEDVILIDVFRTIGPNENDETAIDDQIANVLDTFQVR